MMVVTMVVTIDDGRDVPNPGNGVGGQVREGPSEERARGVHCYGAVGMPWRTCSGSALGSSMLESRVKPLTGLSARRPLVRQPTEPLGGLAALTGGDAGCDEPCAAGGGEGVRLPLESESVELVRLRPPSAGNRLRIAFCTEPASGAVGVPLGG